MGKWIKKMITCILIMVMVTVSVPAGNHSRKVSAAQKFRIHFIDVGCADAALLQYGEGKNAKYAMIDTGAVSYHETKNKKYQKKNDPAYAYLKKIGVKRLEFVILTHPHQDHIGGMVKILKDPTIIIDRIYGNDLNIQYLKSSEDKTKQSSETARWTKFDSSIYKRMIKWINKRNQQKDEALHVKYIVPKEGSKITLGQAKITFYGPLDNHYTYGRQVNLNTRQENKYSIVTRIVYGSNSFLMTGDAQKETIQKIIKKGYNLKAQVLKEPHHGYQDLREADKLKTNVTSDHKLLIDKSQANITVISNGYQNTGNVPVKLVLKDLSKTDVYETGDKGTIVITSDGSRLSIKTEKGVQNPSVSGRIISAGKSVSMPVLQSIDIKTNIKNKLIPTYVEAKNTYNIYSNKKVKIRFGGSARSFSKINSIKYKFVKKGKSSEKVAYKTGRSVTIKNGNVGRIYISYNTIQGIKEIKLPGIVVDTKAPTKAKIKRKKAGKKKIKATFQADYGLSGKKKTQYKIVPKGKKAKKYKWKTANSVKYNTKKNKKAKLYVRFIDKAGNITTKKLKL